MCVTNTARRNPVKLAGSQLQSKPSELSQRICSSLFLGTQLSKPTPTTSTVAAINQVPLPVVQKSRRKRQPQKPGKTAKNNDRHFVQHHYHDHALDRDLEASAQSTKRRRGGVTVAFPLKLHAMLDQIEQDGHADVISWQPHGRCFVVHKPKEFVDNILQKYFKQSKLTSFQRQLNLYGFQRLTRGHDAGGYYHELFLRGKTFLCKKMTRTKVKGTGFKAASSPEDEPDFWRMPPVNPITPPQSEDDSSSTYSESTAPEETPSSVFPSFSLVMSSVPRSFAFEAPQEEASEEQMSIEAIPYSAQVSESGSEVLDEVVDELFLHEAPEENDDILDFVNTWNPYSFSEEEIEDDLQLGLLLERILAE